MTRYDGVYDKNGNLHPLAGVPQEVLDAARQTLIDCTPKDRRSVGVDGEYGRLVPADEISAIVDAVVLAAWVELKKLATGEADE